MSSPVEFVFGFGQFLFRVFSDPNYLVSLLKYGFLRLTLTLERCERIQFSNQTSLE